MQTRVLMLTCLILSLITSPSWASGNRLAYPDTMDPYYVSREFPKLTTPQWVGEDGVEAVVVLAIDDMRDHKKYEAYLRPILNRLKKIDGRAPVSIMTNRISSKEPHLQKWLKEGLSLDTHTYDHPCPFFKKGKFATAKETYDKCVDQMFQIPGNRPVAFRMPCCDSMNTPSPRFYAEMINKTTEKGHFLTIDSSVFLLLTADDPELPRELVLDKNGSERFRKYLPKDRTFVNTIEDYPYPYVMGRLCWEFPCMTPSDWQAQHLHKPNNPLTVRDWEAALDAIVHKQGAFTMVFHPHGWIRNDQIVELIDYADRKYGKRVKFLTFREAEDRINQHLLIGHPIRHPKTGMDNGVRLLDVNADGFLDVVVGNDELQQTRIWMPNNKSWRVCPFPGKFVSEISKPGAASPEAFRFGVLQASGQASFVVCTRFRRDVYHFEKDHWVRDDDSLAELKVQGDRFYTCGPHGEDKGARLRDLDGDGLCELLVSNPKQNAVFQWNSPEESWELLPFSWPAGTTLVDEEGQERGVCFVDLNEDGQLDLLCSNEKEYGIHLFKDMKSGWSRKVVAGKQGDENSIPMISRNGTNNGFWVHSRSLWWSNEDTALLKDHVDKRSFHEMLRGIQPGPKSPQASLECIEVRPGFRVELVTAEPLVQDPIAFDWGPDGKLWVVEMGDYPLGVDGQGKFGGRVKFLQDKDGDGRYDQATIFLEGLGYPSGVMPWKKGVLVSCAPDILYAEDTDGDGKADIRKVLYTGFRQGNQQHRVNGFSWGLDNWIYCANGDSGGRIKSLATGQEVNISGRDVRIRPWDGSIEATTGQTQFGRNRDDWGNWFGGNNSNPMWHFVLDDNYLKRNPFLAPPKLRIPVSTTPGSAPVYPVSRTLPRFNNINSANRFTSACSPIIYRDKLFGPAFVNSTFVSEPVHNLVHREVMTAKGVTFTSSRSLDEQLAEFLASSDNWFRPTMIKTGPDGALWIADMYRHVIEHPQWIPKDWQKKLDLRAGHDKGRIYRVYPIGAKLPRIPRLDQLPVAKLVAALDSPNGWQRDMVQQLLLEKKDKGAIPLLQTMVTESQNPLARLHALCTLSGLHALTPELVKKSLQDTHPGVRRHAVRLCETLLAESPELGKFLMPLEKDADAQVQVQLAYTLGAWKSPQAGQVLGRLATKHARDPYLLAAVMSSVNGDNLEGTLVALLGNQEAPPVQALEPLLRMSTLPEHRPALVNLLKRITKDENGNYAEWQLSALAHLVDYLDQRKLSLSNLPIRNDPGVKLAVQRVPLLFSAARKLAGDAKAPLATRIAAIRLLGRNHDHQEKDREQLVSLLVPQHPVQIQEAALQGLGGLKHPSVPRLLVQPWKGYTPELRGLALDLLLQRKESLPTLLKAVEAKMILPQEIDAARRQRLLEYPSAKVREQAARLLKVGTNTQRDKVLAAFQAVLKKEGNLSRGEALFRKTCAACHKLADLGQPVGPDLAALKDHSRQALLEAILDPNRAVEAKYVNYTVLTKDGRVFSGMIGSESSNSITLVGVDGKEKVLLRNDVEEFVSNGKSLMPEGLEKDLSVQDAADLIAFVQDRVAQVQEKSKE